MLRELISRIATRLRRRDAGASGDPAAGATAAATDRPLLRRSLRYTSLQFDRASAQSRMLRAQPDRLLVDYTRTMMGALLWAPDPRLIGIVGLGGGSQPKFCYRHLPAARIEVAEINPAVLALRRRFRIPDDDSRLAVRLADGADFVRRSAGRFDLLLVDGYDARGLAPSLSTRAFYEDCRQALTARGAMSVNLYGPGHGAHLEHLRSVFGTRLLVVTEARQSNRVVFAWNREAMTPARGRASGDGSVPGLGAEGLAELRDTFARVVTRFAQRERPPRRGAARG